MCDLCGSSGNTSTNTTTVQNNVPPWISNAGESIFNRGNALSQQGYQPYGQGRIAPFTNDTMSSFGMTQQAAPSYGPYMDAAGGAASSALGGFNPVPYMNPYWQQIAQGAGNEAIRQDDVARQGRSASAVNAGAFGGSRHALMESEAQRNLQNRVSDIYMRGGSEAYDRGTSAFFQDATRSNTGANTLSALGQQEQTLGLTGAGALGAIGTQQQQQGQRSMDLAYQNFQEQRDFPQNQLSYLANLFKGQQQPNMGSTSSTTGTQPSGSLLGQLGSLGLGAYGLSQMFGNKRGGPVRRRRYGIGGPVRRFQQGGRIRNDDPPEPYLLTDPATGRVVPPRDLSPEGLRILRERMGSEEYYNPNGFLENLIAPSDPSRPSMIRRTRPRQYGVGGPIRRFAEGGPAVGFSFEELMNQANELDRTGNYAAAADLRRRMMQAGQTPPAPALAPVPPRGVPPTWLQNQPHLGVLARTLPGGAPPPMPATIASMPQDNTPRDPGTGELLVDPGTGERIADSRPFAPPTPPSPLSPAPPLPAIAGGGLGPNTQGLPPGSTLAPRPVTSLPSPTGTRGTAGALPNSIQAATAAPAAVLPAPFFPTENSGDGGLPQAQSTIRDAMSNNIDRGEAILMMAARMGEAASRPGATFIGSLGAGGTAGLENLRGQRRDARDAARYEQTLGRQDRTEARQERQDLARNELTREGHQVQRDNARLQAEASGRGAGAATSIQIRALERANEIIHNPESTEAQRAQARDMRDSLSSGRASSEQRAETAREARWTSTYNDSIAASRREQVDPAEARRIAQADADAAVRGMGIASGRTPAAAAPAAPATAAPLPMPANPADRVVGQPYRNANGAVRIWTGAGWQ